MAGKSPPGSCASRRCDWVREDSRLNIRRYRLNIAPEHDREGTLVDAPDGDTEMVITDLEDSDTEDESGRTVVGMRRV